jgi:hypothetical protein
VVAQETREQIGLASAEKNEMMDFESETFETENEKFGPIIGRAFRNLFFYILIAVGTFLAALMFIGWYIDASVYEIITTVLRALP